VIKSSESINVLGVTFDSKLGRSTHINKAVGKANKALNAFKLKRKFFNTTELMSLITSNFYTILYYNSEVWHIHNLKQYDKTTLQCLIWSTSTHQPLQGSHNQLPKAAKKAKKSNCRDVLRLQVGFNAT
jgi:predicted secreted protein